MDFTDDIRPPAVKSRTSCCVPTCNKPAYINTDEDKITFHSMPRDKKMLDTWIVKIRRDIGTNFHITKHTRICSRHFLSADFRITPKGRRFLKENAVPSVFTWTKQKIVRKVRDMSCAVEIPPCDNDPKPECNNDKVQEDDKLIQLEYELAKMSKLADLYKNERDHARTMLGKKGKSQTFSVEQFQNSDRDICFYTGFATYLAFTQCFKLLNPLNNIVYIDAKGRKWNRKNKKLSLMNEFFMTLVRLRLGLFELDLAHRFNVSKGSVHRVCISWINFMYLRLGSINIWPSSDAIRTTMPENVKDKFPDLEWIIDAFEFQCERPSSLMLQSQSYSSYKSRNTLKGLVACTPSGQLGFVSQLYTGNLSDRELVIRSGFLRMPHRRGAVWLVDKGFQIQDLADPLGVKINMPAFVGSRSQMTADEVFKTQVIASERIHIERAINKVKFFHIFDSPTKISMFGSINQIWSVCSLLTLFQNPIISA